MHVLNSRLIGPFCGDECLNEIELNWITEIPDSIRVSFEDDSN